MSRYKLLPQDPYDVFMRVAKNGTASLQNRYTGNRVLGSEYVGPASDVRKGYALGADQVYGADLERQLNRASYSDAVEGMKDAGLNPALMYGQATSPQTASVQATNTQTEQDRLASFMPILNSLSATAGVTMDAIRMKHEMPNIDNDTTLMGMDIDDRLEDIKQKQVQTRLLTTQADIAERTADFVVKIAEHNASIAEITEEMTRVAKKLQDNELKISDETLQAVIDKAQYEKDTAYWISRINEQEANFKSQYQDLLANLMKAQALGEYAKVDEIRAQIRKLALESDLLEKDKENYDDNQFLMWTEKFTAFENMLIVAYSQGLNAMGSGMTEMGTKIFDAYQGQEVNAWNTFFQRWHGHYSSSHPDGKLQGEANAGKPVVEGTQSDYDPDKIEIGRDGHAILPKYKASKTQGKLDRFFFGTKYEHGKSSYYGRDGLFGRWFK